ncbi:MAG: hypothetical protein ACQESR_13195 [Planctomycetota bacterium]
MIAFSTNSGRWEVRDAYWARFEQILPEIESQARHAFPGLETHQLEKLVAEVTERAFHVFLQLSERGRGDIAYAKPLAKSAIKSVRKTRGFPPVKPR